MDIQSAATAVLLIPTLVLGVIAWRARGEGRTDLGLRLRDGGPSDIGRGLVWGVATLAAYVAVLTASGVLRLDGDTAGWGSTLGIAAYFLVLFTLEEIAFRSLFLTGLGVVVGVLPAIVVVSVLVALPYSFSPDTSVLALVGAVVTNAVNGVARWRTGRIWFGLAWRWVLNVGFLAIGLPDAGFELERPVIGGSLDGPDWLTGGGFGLEAGVVGIAIELIVLLLVLRWAGGRGRWAVRPRTTTP